MSIERPLDTKDAAEMLGVTPRTIIRLAKRGEIASFKVGDLYKFHRRDLEAFMENQKHGRPANDQ